MDPYVKYYLLSLFDRDQGAKPAQLYHILCGKRTGSTLFQSIKNNLAQFFGLFPQLDRHSFDQFINKSISQSLLFEQEAGFFALSDLGQERLTAYFSGHPYPHHIDQRQFGFYDQIFWVKLVFVTQILSERTHDNIYYSPVTSSLPQQFWVKKWLGDHYSKDLPHLFQREWISSLQTLDTDQANFIAQQLSGFNRVGKTAYQLLGDVDFRLFQKQAVHQLMVQLVAQSHSLPYFNSIATEALREGNYQLSKSALHTAQLVKKKWSVDKMAQHKSVRPGTVTDHLLEMKFFHPSLDLSYLYNQADLNRVHHFFDQGGGSFRDFTDQEGDYPFYKFRLIEWQIWEEDSSELK